MHSFPLQCCFRHHSSFANSFPKKVRMHVEICLQVWNWVTNTRNRNLCQLQGVSKNFKERYLNLAYVCLCPCTYELQVQSHRYWRRSQKMVGAKSINMLHEPFLYEYVLFYVFVVPVITAWLCHLTLIRMAVSKTHMRRKSDCKMN